MPKKNRATPLKLFAVLSYLCHVYQHFNYVSLGTTCFPSYHLKLFMVLFSNSNVHPAPDYIGFELTDHCPCPVIFILAHAYQV